MKRVGLLLIGILGFALIAVPAMAATDTVDVTISVPALSTFAAGVDVTLTATVTDLDNTYVFTANASTMTLQDNTSGWTLTAELDAAYTNYTLWIEDTQAAGNATGVGFKQIPVTPTTVALDTFVNYGNTGDMTFQLDWLATGLSWTTYQGDQQNTVTFTHTT
jgi:hypothetical protein